MLRNAIGLEIINFFIDNNFSFSSKQVPQQAGCGLRGRSQSQSTREWLGYSHPRYWVEHIWPGGEIRAWGPRGYSGLQQPGLSERDHRTPRHVRTRPRPSHGAAATQRNAYVHRLYNKSHNKINIIWILVRRYTQLRPSFSHFQRLTSLLDQCLNVILNQRSYREKYLVSTESNPVPPVASQCFTPRL